MIKYLTKVVVVCMFYFSNNVLADDTCYGYTSTTTHFECGTHGNCVWWAASMRPDIATVISGGGWNGGQWYDKLSDLGFSVGSVAEVGSIVEFSYPPHVAYVTNTHDGSFDVSEMDYWGSEGFVNGVNYATYHPNSDGTYHRNSGSKKWILKGFIYGKNKPVSGQTVSVRKLGNYAWYPAEASCVNASAWYGLDSQGNLKSSYTSAVCDVIWYQFGDIFYNVLFGQNANMCY